ncbi:MAG: xanthine dehydrogenase family protein subunit M [Pseudolabrys sp.]
MKPAPFAYVRPLSITEAVAVLGEHGSAGRIIAGGQSLGAMLNMRLVTPKVLIDINRIAGANSIEKDRTRIRVGATVRQSDALSHTDLNATPLIKEALPHVGHFQTRNRGTICGSIAHADPSAELPLALLVSDGAVELRSKRGTRIVAADDFLVSTLTTARREDEMVVATLWPSAPARSGCAFDEFAIRGGDYAIVAAAAQVSLDAPGNITSIRVGLAGVGERPILIDTSQLIGDKPSDGVAEEIMDRARRSIEPISDMQASAEYRTHLAGIFARRVFDAAIRRAHQRDDHA